MLQWLTGKARKFSLFIAVNLVCVENFKKIAQTFIHKSKVNVHQLVVRTTQI